MPLSAGAWVDLRLGFVTAADELFDVLASTVPWHEERMHIYDTSVRAPRLRRLFQQNPQGQHHKDRAGVGDLPLEMAAFNGVRLHGARKGASIPNQAPPERQSGAGSVFQDVNGT